MVPAASRRRFLRYHLPSFALLALTIPDRSTAMPLPGPGERSTAGAAVAIGDDIVLYNGWILRRSDLDHLR
jgi:hypothetical protein